MKSQKIKIAIVDNKAIFRQSLRRLVEKEPDFGVVADAELNLDGIKTVGKHKPDVILMNRSEPFTDGLQDTKIVIAKFPDTKVIILSPPSERTVAATLCEAWVCHNLCRNCRTEEIFAAIRKGLPQGWGREKP